LRNAALIVKIGVVSGICLSRSHHVDAAATSTIVSAIASTRAAIPK
jgi:hypothetical protein